jgi:hypothetical protein
MQSAQDLTTLLGEHTEEPAQGGLAGDGFNAQHLSHGGITLQPGHPGEFVRPAQDAAHIAQRHIRRIIGIRTGRIVRQYLAQLLAKLLLSQKVRPDDQPAVGGQPLIGEADPAGRRSVFRVNLEPHRLVRLLSRPGILFWFHHHKPAKRCSLFQAESFRLRGEYQFAGADADWRSCSAFAVDGLGGAAQLLSLVRQRKSGSSYGVRVPVE